MKLNCPRCNKPWTDLEIENQICSECGSPADYDPVREELQKQLDNDPEYQKHLAKQAKKERKNYWTQTIVYIVGAVIVAMIGLTGINPDLGAGAWLGIGFAVTIPVYHLLKYLIDISP